MRVMRQGRFMPRPVDQGSRERMVEASTVLERALHVLKIARDELSIDGLKASEVAKVLSDKFRLRTTRQRVGQVLDAAGNYVDRVPGSGELSSPPEGV